MDRIKGTAIHEAGHAVAVYHSPTLPAVLGVTLGIGQRGGCVHLGELDPVRLDERAFAEAMRAFAAGFMAEAIAGGRPRFEGGDADKLLHLRVLSAEWTIRRAPVPATRIARGVAVRRAVSAADSLARDAALDAELLLRAHWGEVELVAARLLECGGMNAALLASTIERAGRTPRPRVGDSERIFGLLSGFVGRNPELEQALRAQLA